MSSTTTLIGNATSDIELRFTQGGKAVGSLTIAVSDRVKNKTTQEWEDGKTWFARCTIWGEFAEHAAASITKGTRVIAFGRIEQREWEDKDQNKRTSVEVTLEAIGADLRYATAQVTRTASTGTRTASTGTRTGDNSPSGDSYPSTEVPTSQNADSWNTPANDSETPF